MNVPPAPHISIEALGKTYRGASHAALSGVSFVIPRGSFFGLLGPNGAGKTTLISILCGLLAPTAGKIAIHTPEGAVEPATARRHLGLVPQELAFYPALTVAENLRFFGAMQGLRGRVRAARIAECATIARLEGVWNQRAETLSGGLRRRLNFAIGIVHTPALLVLDEPTVGVDAESRQCLQQSLRALNDRGTTIVYTSHYLEEVQQLCSRFAVIDQGRLIVAGARDDLLRAELVELRLSAPPSAALIERLRRIGAISQVRHDGATLALATEVPAAALAEILATLAHERAQLVELRMGARSLEALFFQLTGARRAPAIENAGIA